MKDFLGQTLKIGDFIVLNDKRYSKLSIGKIIDFTPKNLKAYCLEVDCGYTPTPSLKLCSSGQVFVIDLDNLKDREDFSVPFRTV